MYQKRLLPYFITPSSFSRQASSPLEHSRWRDNILQPLLPYLSSCFFHWVTQRLQARFWSLVQIPKIANFVFDGRRTENHWQITGTANLMSRNVSFNFARYLTSGQEKISLPITTEATWRPVMPDDLSGYHQHGLTRTGEQKDLTMSRRKRNVIKPSVACKKSTMT